MARPNSNPSDAAQRLTALRRMDHPRWKKELERAFADGATMNEAAERLGGMSRMTLQRHVNALEEETGRRLERPLSGREEAPAPPVRRKRA